MKSATMTHIRFVTPKFRRLRRESFSGSEPMCCEFCPGEAMRNWPFPRRCIRRRVRCQTVGEKSGVASDLPTWAFRTHYVLCVAQRPQNSNACSACHWHILRCRLCASHIMGDRKLILCTFCHPFLVISSGYNAHMAKQQHCC